MKIRANQDLFNRLWSLGDKISSMRGIVQNDMELPCANIFDWKVKMKELRTEMEELEQEVNDWVFDD